MKRNYIAEIMFAHHSHADMFQDTPSRIVYTEEDVVAILELLGHPAPEWGDEEVVIEEWTPEKIERLKQQVAAHHATRTPEQIQRNEEMGRQYAMEEALEKLTDTWNEIKKGLIKQFEQTEETVKCMSCSSVIAIFKEDKMIPGPQACHKAGNVPVPNLGWFCGQECAIAYETMNKVTFHRVDGKIDYYPKETNNHEHE